MTELSRACEVNFVRNLRALTRGTMLVTLLRLIRSAKILFDNFGTFGGVKICHQKNAANLSD